MACGTFVESFFAHQSVGFPEITSSKQHFKEDSQGDCKDVTTLTPSYITKYVLREGWERLANGEWETGRKKVEGRYRGAGNRVHEMGFHVVVTYFHS